MGRHLVVLFLLVFLFMFLISPPPRGGVYWLANPNAGSVLPTHASFMWKVWIHAACTRGTFLALKNTKAWVEYAGWVQYGAVRFLHGLLYDFLCSCVFMSSLATL